MMHHVLQYWLLSPLYWPLQDWNDVIHFTSTCVTSLLSAFLCRSRFKDQQRPCWTGHVRKLRQNKQRIYHIVRVSLSYASLYTWFRTLKDCTSLSGWRTTSISGFWTWRTRQQSGKITLTTIRALIQNFHRPCIKHHTETQLSHLLTTGIHQSPLEDFVAVLNEDVLEIERLKKTKIWNSH